MNPLSSRIALAALLLTGLAAPSMAQEEAVPRQQQAEAPPPAPAPARVAVPRSQPTERSQPVQRSQPVERSQPAVASVPVHEERAAEQRRGTDSQGRVRSPRAGSGGDNGGRGNDNGGRGNDNGGRRSEPRSGAVGRAPAPPPTTVTREPRRESPPPSVAPPATASAGDESQRRAEPRGSRPRDGNPAVGRAEPRDGRYYPSDGRDYPRRGGIYTSRGRVYNSYYYYYPRRWYPYGYGAFGGLGYFYYDPYTWYSYDPYWSHPHYSAGSYGAYYGGSGYYETGELRLQVVPRHAEVYVDGYFAGHVDDFDGMFQALRLEEGGYKIEIVAPGFETLEIDVRVQPGRKTTYRGELRRLP